MKGKYRIKTQKGYITYVSHFEIYEKLRKLGKEKALPFNLISLVEVLGNPNFSDEYAKKIRLLILEYYYKIKPELTSEEKKAMYKCYNSLQNPEKECITAKRRFLFSLIETFANALKFKNEEARKEWVLEKYGKYKTEKSLMYDFDRTILKE